MKKIVLLLAVWSVGAFADLATSKSPASLVKSVVDKSLSSSPNDLSKVNARIRVEGASFRSFNLFLPPFKLGGEPAATSAARAKEIRDIVERDLNIVGGFNFISHSDGKSAGSEALLRQKGAEGISRVTVSSRADKLDVFVEHSHLINGSKKVKNFSLSQKDVRKLSHMLSQSIFEAFIGPENIFLSQIAAVKRGPSGSQIVIFDFDGGNEKVISSGTWAKASPYFAPDGNNIFYTVISEQGQGIVEQKLGAENFSFRIKKTGLNLDARAAPDNSYLLATLSYGKAANIYKAKRNGDVLGKVTDSLGLNLSPSISLDGREMAFVSTRSGTPQIYVQDLSSGRLAQKNAQRLTFQGNYNQTPHFSPDGSLVAFTGRDERKVFDVFIVNRKNGVVSRVTENQGRNQEPFFSHSGRYLIFKSDRDGKSYLYIATLNGAHQYPIVEGNYFSPVIRPLS